jgi:hypothetical protein
MLYVDRFHQCRQNNFIFITSQKPKGAKGACLMPVQGMSFQLILPLA